MHCGRRRRAQRDLILELGREYLADERGASVAGFATWLDLATRADVAIEPGVTLATFHRAKGLEWPLVFVTGLERGLVPISWATSADARAEERRLLHVALSRAESELHLSWARRRTLGTRHVTREPSAWLASLDSEARRHQGRSTDRYAHLAEVRRTRLRRRLSIAQCLVDVGTRQDGERARRSRCSRVTVGHPSDWRRPHRRQP